MDAVIPALSKDVCVFSRRPVARKFHSASVRNGSTVPVVPAGDRYFSRVWAFLPLQVVGQGSDDARTALDTDGVEME
jgi:hypothetical protein